MNESPYSIAFDMFSKGQWVKGKYCLLFNYSAVLNSFVTPGTVAHQGPLFIELHGQEYWGGLPFLPPGDLPGPGIEPMSPVSPALQAILYC